MSLLLWLGVAALWATSARLPPATELYRGPYQNGEWVIHLEPRRVVLRVTPYPRVCPVFLVPNAGARSAIVLPTTEIHGAIPGIVWQVELIRPPAAGQAMQVVARQFAIDCGWACAALGVLPVAGFFLLRKKRKRSGPFCPSCAYNLTGNTSGICPECGTPTAAGKQA